MLNKKEVENIMYNRGFYEQMSCKNSNQVTSMTFNTMRLDDTNIACTVNLIKETFRFDWCVPHSINRLTTPDCGSLFDDAHFNNIYEKIKQQSRILYNAYY